MNEHYFNDSKNFFLYIVSSVVSKRNFDEFGFYNHAHRWGKMYLLRMYIEEEGWVFWNDLSIG